MMKRSICSVILGLAILAWGCKKTDTSEGARAPDEAEASAPSSPSAEEPTPEEPTPEEPPSEDSASEAAESTAPEEDVFTVKLETTKGDIIIDVHREWAPLGAARFEELVSAGFYNDVAFFRVMAGFMAQTGVSGKPKLNAKWGNKPLRDEPPKQKNTRGMVTFAKAGLNSRTTQFFINLVDNTQLDAMGFSPFGKVRDMTAVEALYSGYGDGPPGGKGPNQQRIKQKGNKYLKAKFPKLDYIVSATIVAE
jgi:peptidyl-prolyl cis-trans isomerase A (cyclophilin A)